MIQPHLYRVLDWIEKKLYDVRMRRTSGPRFIHDCKDCQFLGAYDTDERAQDLYFCPRSDGGTYIARWGSDGPSYSSYPTFIVAQFTPSDFKSLPWVAEANRRHRDRS